MNEPTLGTCCQQMMLALKAGTLWKMITVDAPLVQLPDDLPNNEVIQFPDDDRFDPDIFSPLAFCPWCGEQLMQVAPMAMSLQEFQARLDVVLA